MKTTDYLDAAKAALGISSDYALAIHLKFSRAAISKLRTGKLVMSNTNAVKIAEIIGVDPLKVIADCELERGTNDELWTRIAKQVAVIAAGISSYLMIRAMLPDLTMQELLTVAFVYPATVLNTHCAVYLAVLLLTTLALAPRPRWRA